MGKKSRRRPGRQRQSQPLQRHQQPPPQLPQSLQPNEGGQQQPQQLPPSDNNNMSMREKADLLMEGFNLCSSHFNDPWHANRVNYLNLYYHMAFEHPVEIDFGTKEDRKFVRTIRRSETEPNFFRAIALFLSGWICFQNGKYRYQDALDYADRAIALCDSASEREKERMVVLGTGENAVRVKVGDYLEVLRQRCAFPNQICNNFTMVGWDPLDDDKAEVPVPVIGGLECDCCHKSREELGTARLKVCSFCHLAYYCSTECQTKAWQEEGHKILCRKKGEFKKGDVAYILEEWEMLDFVTEGDRNDRVDLTPDDLQSIGSFKVGERVRILGSDCDDPSLRIVQQVHGSGCCIVPVRHLMRCRPALWKAFGKEELEQLRDMVIGSQAEEASSSGGGNDETESGGEEIMPKLVGRELSNGGDDDTYE